MTHASGAPLPGSGPGFPLCRLSEATSAWRATVVFTNLPKIAPCRGASVSNLRGKHNHPTQRLQVVRGLPINTAAISEGVGVGVEAKSFDVLANVFVSLPNRKAGQQRGLEDAWLERRRDRFHQGLMADAAA